MLDVSFRRAQPSDAPALIVIGRQTFYETYPQITSNDLGNMEQYLDEVFTPESLIQSLGKKEEEYWLLYKGGELAGYVRLIPHLPYEGVPGQKPVHLEKFYLYKTFWGQKLGHYMMEQTLAYVRQEGYDCLWLGVWDVNKAAVKFYERLGFEEIGIHRFPMGETIYEDILMIMKL